MTWRGRNIYLIGLPGAGKSAIGREAAAMLAGSGYEFVDLDDAIERTSNQSIAEIFASVGEEGFRKLERDALLKIASDQSATIVATGGGVVLDARNRSIMRGSGIPVWIDVSVREAAKNVERDISDGAVRPLFQGLNSEEIVQQMRSLHETRRPFYEQATLHFVTKSPRGDERTPGELAQELINALEEMSLHVALKPRFQTIIAKSALGEYPVLVGSGVAGSELTFALRDLGARNIVTITDTNVAPLHAAEVHADLKSSLGTNFNLHQITIEAGEKNKSKETLFQILEGLNELELPRKSTVVLAIGGGVVTDIAALAANLYKRGIPVIHIPTTLLAQVDAAIGGKTGIDLFAGKNLIGTFYPPKQVLVDPVFLKTLDKRELHAGLAEVVKYALIGSKPMWDELSGGIRRLIRGVDATYPALIKESIVQKLKCVEQDEFEQKSGVRELLNFGHTFGHALESATCFEVFLHGEAVALGMRAAAWLSKELGYINDDVWASIEVVLGRIPIKPSVQLNTESVLAALRKDKKRVDAHRLILLRGIGDAFVTEVPEADVTHAIDYMLSLL